MLELKRNKNHLNLTFLFYCETKVQKDYVSKH